MTKILLSVKNNNPKIYGYGSLQALKDAAPHYDENNNLLEFSISYKDADGDNRYIPCTEEYFKYYRNMFKDEKDKLDLESRCSIPADYFLVDGEFKRIPEKNPHKELKKCMCDCKHCPFLQDKEHLEVETAYSRKGQAISLNNTFTDDEGNEEEFLNRFADESQVDSSMLSERELQKAQLFAIIKDFTPYEQDILKMFNEGYSDQDIANKFGKGRKTIQEKRIRLINSIKEKVK